MLRRGDSHLPGVGVMVACVFPFVSQSWWHFPKSSAPSGVNETTLENESTMRRTGFPVWFTGSKMQWSDTCVTTGADMSPGNCGAQR